MSNGTALAKTQSQAPSIVSDEISRYLAQGYNLLAPTKTVMQHSPFHKPRLEIVQLSCNERDRDVYFSKSFMKSDYNKDTKESRPLEFAIAKNGLSKLSRASGIDVVESKRIDDMKDPLFCCFTVICSVRNADGTVSRGIGTQDVDLRPGGGVEAQLRKQVQPKIDYGVDEWYTDDNGSRKKRKVKFTESEAEAWVAKELRSMAGNKVAMCETKSLLRAVRYLLAVKPVYTLEEIQKPFVVVHIDFAPDYNRVDVRQAVLASATGAQAALYGETPSSDAIDAEYRVRTMQNGEYEDEAEDIPLGAPPPEKPTDDSAAADADDDPVFDGTTLSGWKASLIDAITYPEVRAIIESLNRLKPQIKAIGRWQEMYDLAMRRLKESREGAA